MDQTNNTIEPMTSEVATEQDTVVSSIPTRQTGFLSSKTGKAIAVLGLIVALGIAGAAGAYIYSQYNKNPDNGNEPIITTTPTVTTTSTPTAVITSTPTVVVTATPTTAKKTLTMDFPKLENGFPAYKVTVQVPLDAKLLNVSQGIYTITGSNYSIRLEYRYEGMPWSYSELVELGKTSYGTKLYRFTRNDLQDWVYSNGVYFQPSKCIMEEPQCADPTIYYIDGNKVTQYSLEATCTKESSLTECDNIILSLKGQRVE